MKKTDLNNVVDNTAMDENTAKQFETLKNLQTPGHDLRNFWEKVESNLDSETTSYTESFPKAGDSPLFTMLSKIFNQSSPTIASILKQNGLTKGLEKLTGFQSDGLTQEKLEEAVKSIAEETVKEGKLLTNAEYKDFKDIQAILHNIENVKLQLDGILKHMDAIDMALSAVTIISPILTWKTALVAYDKFIIGNNIVHLEERRRLMRSFNRVSVPLVVSFYVYLQLHHRLLTKAIPLITDSVASSTSNALGINGTSQASLLGFYSFNRLPNFLKKLIYITIILGFITYFPSFLKHFSPWLFQYCSDNISHGYYLFAYTLFIYLLALVVQYCLELYLFILFSTTQKNSIQKPKNLPKPLERWLSGIENHSEVSEDKRPIIHMYFRIILFHFLILITFGYFFIF